MTSQRAQARRMRKLARRHGDDYEANSIGSRNTLHLRELRPITKNQHRVFDSYHSGKNLFLSGMAGCGKTYLALGLALQDIIRGSCTQDKILIMRSVVPTRDMGFLPGSAKEKSRVYEAPYQALCTEMFGRGDAYELLKQKSVLEFCTTSFIRGLTICDTIIIVDEIQNMTDRECDSLMTRIGQNSRIIFCGDLRQSDLNERHERCGMRDFVRIVSSMHDDFDCIEFGIEDIVRSDLVKNYLIQKTRLETQHVIEPFGAV